MAFLIRRPIDWAQNIHYIFSCLANYKIGGSVDEFLLILKALSDKNRLRIFYALLSYQELCACQITEFLNVTGATASRHLSLMVTAGILKNRKQGRWVYFRLNTEDTSLKPIVHWVKQKLGHSAQLKKDLEALNRIAVIPCEDLSRKQREGSSCSKKSGN
jgi:ArsR family transcriptional regulator